MNRLKLLRENRGLLQSDIAKIINVSTSAYGFYETGKRDIPTNTLVLLADYFGVSSDYILGNDKSNLLINVYSSVHAGILSEMIENIVDTEEISEKMAHSDKTYFGIKVKGDSMNPNYQEGDTLIVEKTSTCNNGDDCIVAINGNEAFLKRVYINSNGITLQALNPKYEPLYYTNDDIKNIPVTIIGIVRELRRKI